ncbi:MAG: DUF86 domain-containing protein [Candidatus Hodarchaeota archaeon]
MTSKDLAYLKHIRDAIAKIAKYLGDISYDSFLENDLVQDAVIRQIEIMGEATKRLSQEIRTSHPFIPWKSIAGMRDKLIHDYLGVDPDAVWDTVTNDLPALKKEITNLISQESKISI